VALQFIKLLFKTKVIICISLITCLLGVSACGDDVPEPQPKSKAELFAGASLKTWGIEKLVVNDTLIQLTADQLLYAKTYKRDSSFVDTDGLQGSWNLDANASTLKETLKLGGSGTLTYKVESLSETALQLRLISDGTNTFNTLYQFRAK